MEKYVQNVSQNLGIDSGIIGAILSALMDFLSGCGNKPSPEEVIAADGIKANFLLNRALRANDIKPLSREGKKIKETMITEAKSLKKEEAEEFLSMCAG